ncbi:MFS transporter [Enterococcus florum]|uniref:MFS transporter n=1 Tax=Enterococcus florum TaxID=2480627 RepID=A0A4P5P898_9ENTE|nr:MFS transporter [Enterococcus florum]GCF94060.1 MFS transporter [Enterococcus florum]
MERTKETTTIWTKDFILLMLVTFFSGCAINSQMGTLPLYVESLGGSKADSGVIIGMLGVSALLFRLPIGKLLDQYGRKVILGIGLFLLLMDFGLLNIWSGLFALLILRFIQGVGNGTQSTAAGAMMSDLIPKDQLSIGLGYFSIAQVLPSAIGPVIGLAVVQHSGFQSLFRVGLVFTFLAFFMSLFVSERYKEQKRSKKDRPIRKGYAHSLIRKPVMVPTLVMFLICLANSGVIAFLVQYAMEKGIAGASCYFTIMALVTVFFRLCFPSLIRKVKESRLIAVSIMSIAGAFFLIAISSSLSQLIAAAVLYGIGFASVLPLMNTIVLMNVAADQKGSGTAIFTSALDVAYGGGVMIWGVLAAARGFFVMYLCCGLLAILALAIFLLFSKNLC